MKKAFDNAKAANQFVSSSNYFFFAAFFFVAFFFIGIVLCSSYAIVFLVLEKLHEPPRLSRSYTCYYKILGLLCRDVKNICEKPPL